MLFEVRNTETGELLDVGTCPGNAEEARMVFEETTGIKCDIVRVDEETGKEVE